MGEILGCVMTDWEQGFKTRYTLYKTKMGKYVCEREGLTQHEACTSSFKAIVLSKDEEERIIEFFGLCDLAKSLYNEAQIKYEVEIQ